MRLALLSLRMPCSCPCLLHHLSFLAAAFTEHGNCIRRHTAVPFVSPQAVFDLSEVLLDSLLCEVAGPSPHEKEIEASSCWPRPQNWYGARAGDFAVLYVWEVQVEERAQRKGLGRFLMQLLELIARKCAFRITHLMLRRCRCMRTSFHCCNI